MRDNKPFTIEDAMQIQAKNLAFYEETLKPEYYAKVKAKVDERNAQGYTSPYDVCRGTDIDNIYANIRRK